MSYSKPYRSRLNCMTGAPMEPFPVPVPPRKEFSHTRFTCFHSVECDCVNGVALKDVVLPDGLTWEDVVIHTSFEDDYGGDMMCVELGTNELIVTPNKSYNVELKRYEMQKKTYDKDHATYREELKTYEERRARKQKAAEHKKLAALKKTLLEHGYKAVKVERP